MPENPPQAAAPPAKPWSGGGREELADAVRRLMALTVTAAAPSGVLAEVAREARALADALDGHVPPAGAEPRERFAEHSVGPAEAHTLAASMPFDVVIGSCNPVALPLTVEFDPPRALGLATFTAPYEGAPGCVHGAVLAGAFDIMLTVANVIADGAGPTASPPLRYLGSRPSSASRAVFEAWVTERYRTPHPQPRAAWPRGAWSPWRHDGEFATLDRSRIQARCTGGTSPRCPVTPTGRPRGPT